MRTKTLCQAHLSPSEWASTSPGNRHRPICWQRHHGRNLTLAPGAEAHFHPPENIGSITIHAGCLHVLYIQLNMKSKLNRWTENIIHDQRKASPGRMIWVLCISKVRELFFYDQHAPGDCKYSMCWGVGLYIRVIQMSVCLQPVNIANTVIRGRIYLELTKRTGGAE